MSHVVEFYTLIGSSIHHGRSAVQCVSVLAYQLCVRLFLCFWSLCLFFESTCAACKHFNEEVLQSKENTQLSGFAFVVWPLTDFISLQARHTFENSYVAIKHGLPCIDFWAVQGTVRSCKFWKTCVLTTLLREHWQQFHSYWAKCDGSLGVSNDHSGFVMESQIKIKANCRVQRGKWALAQSCELQAGAECSKPGTPSLRPVSLIIKPFSARFKHLFFFTFCFVELVPGPSCLVISSLFVRKHCSHWISTLIFHMPSVSWNCTWTWIKYTPKVDLKWAKDWKQTMFTINSNVRHLFLLTNDPKHKLF